MMELVKQMVEIKDHVFYDRGSYNKIAVGIDQATVKTGYASAIYDPEKGVYRLHELALFKATSSNSIHVEDRMDALSIALFKRLSSFAQLNSPYTAMNIALEDTFLEKTYPDKSGKALPASVSKKLIGNYYIIRNRIRKLINAGNNLDIKLFDVYNTEWKLSVTGDGGDSKEEIASFVRNECWNNTQRFFHDELKCNQDIVDAFGILKSLVESNLKGVLICE